jgi:hypothetical protein
MQNTLPLALPDLIRRPWPCVACLRQEAAGAGKGRGEA